MIIQKLSNFLKDDPQTIAGACFAVENASSEQVQPYFIQTLLGHINKSSESLKSQPELLDIVTSMLDTVLDNADYKSIHEEVAKTRSNLS